MKSEAAIKNMKAVYRLLSNDVEEVMEYGRNNRNMFALRALFRTHFALVEGMTYQLKQVALALESDLPATFSHEEILLLREKSYFLSKKGHVEEKDEYQSILPSVLFSISSYAKAHGVEFKADTSVHGWGCFREYLKVRNNLMHPKSTDDLEISDETAAVCQEAAGWYKGTLIELFNQCKEN